MNTGIQGAIMKDADKEVTLQDLLALICSLQRRMNILETQLHTIKTIGQDE